MTDAELNEIKLYLQKVKDICSDINECEECPFAYYDRNFTINCAIDDPPAEWNIRAL